MKRKYNSPYMVVRSSKLRASVLAGSTGGDTGNTGNDSNVGIGGDTDNFDARRRLLDAVTLD